MTDDRQDMLPKAGDLRRAAVFVAAWATEDFEALGVAFAEVQAAGKPRRFFAALAEMLTRAYDLRDNPAGLAAWQTDIAKYAQDEIDEQEGNNHGTQAH